MINQTTTFSLLTVDSPYLDLLAQMTHQQWSYEEPWLSQQDIKKRIIRRIMASHNEFSLLAINDDNQLMSSASVIWYELTDKTQRQYWLGEVIVFPAFRLQGLASQLIKHVLTYSKRRDIPELYLYTPDKQFLYQKLGWQEIEYCEVHQQAVSIMRQTL